MTLYEDLEKKSRRRETPYSVSNQQFVPSQHELFPSRLRESEQVIIFNIRFYKIG